MPLQRNPYEKGNLYVKFNVVFPDNNFLAPEKLSVSLEYIDLALPSSVSSLSSHHIIFTIVIIGVQRRLSVLELIPALEFILVPS
jgi:hypothetical protein